MPHPVRPSTGCRQTQYDPDTPPTAYVLCDSYVTAVRVWVQNVFDDGVFVLADEELEGERMVLLLETAELEGCLVECEVTHRSRYDRICVNGMEDTLCAFGLRFLRAMKFEDVHETLLAAFGLVDELDDDLDDDLQRSPREDSLVPLLSAVGLIVVYASQYPW